jgi:cephalosporin-C deacetylase-like acetyl esterase
MPNIVKKTLHWGKGYKRKTVKEKDFLIFPAHNGREIPEQYPERGKPRSVVHYHGYIGNDKIRAIRHFGFNILSDYFYVNL